MKMYNMQLFEGIRYSSISAYRLDQKKYSRVVINIDKMILLY